MRIVWSKILTLLLFIGITSFGFAPNPDVEAENWVTKQLATMSLDDQIAQLMMIEVRPTYGAAHLNKVRQDIQNYRVGGVIFFKGDPLTQVKLTNEYQAMSKTPLLVAIDGEWGLAMRLENTTHFPYQMGLGGIADNTLIYRMGREIGRQCNRMGIHVNFAPVVDVNNNPNNPVINYRSFGEKRENVAAKGWAYASGMQAEQVIACAKHFPGHGDTDVDSHKDLPVIKHNRQRLDSIELYPFRALIDSGVMSVMTAHLYIPAIDNTPKSAISISEKGINGLLRQELGFKGLAFTDALNMQGVAKYHEPGELELKALVAGNDILLAPGNIGKAIQLIKAKMNQDSAFDAYVRAKIRKVLYTKYWVGLNEFQPIKEANLLQDLNTPNASALVNELIENQICVARDQQNLLPLTVNSTAKIATLSIGGPVVSEFQKTVEKYHDVTHHHLPAAVSPTMVTAEPSFLGDAEIVILSLHGTSQYPRNNFGVDRNAAAFVNQLAKTRQVIFVDFGNPYNLKNFQDLKTVVVGYQDDEVNQVKSAQLLFGAISATATLPVTVGSFKPNQSVTLEKRDILKFAKPKDMGVNEDYLNKIDSIVEDAIAKHATPGCQVLIAKDGNVIFHKAYGKHTYNGNRPVRNTDLYDLASLTKVNATTLAIMRLVDDKVIRLTDKLSDYLPSLDTTNKSDITLHEVLTHSAGLKSWIPFYQLTTASPMVYDTTFCDVASDQFCIRVADDLYMCREFQSVIFGTIYDSEIRNKGSYKYSDLGMILMRYLVEQVSHTSFDRFMDSVFYDPMGLRSITFNPLEHVDKEDIVPTEEAADFRKGLIHGYVHDPAASMLGGVSGHAGLFANSLDVAAILQMLMNGGHYNGVQFLQPETIRYFTSYQSNESRRGIGFDKPENSSRRINPCSDYASGKCFGHSGFTGTQMWADPAHGLVYVFLSNRVHPTADNKKLISMSVRTKIMDIMYEASSNIEN